MNKLMDISGILFEILSALLFVFFVFLVTFICVR